MEAASMKQVIKGIPVESTVVESKFSFEIENFRSLKLKDKIETAKIGILEIDANW
jgi:hypothetical protein